MRIDLNSPSGNAFALMGIINDVCRQCGMTRDEASAITAEMRSGNYHDLLRTMERHFPGLFEFSNDPRRPARHADPVPESADECEFGDEEYQWRLWQAGL
jgi:hypothetical protein